MHEVENAKMANMAWFNAVLIVALHVMNFAKPADAMGLNPFVLPAHDVLWFLRKLMLLVCLAPLFAVPYAVRDCFCRGLRCFSCQCPRCSCRSRLPCRGLFSPRRCSRIPASRSSRSVSFYACAGMASSCPGGPQPVF